MSKKIKQIKQLIKKECEKNNLDEFYRYHLLEVEKNALKLLNKLPEANNELVMLAVWLHDLQRIRQLEGDHQQVGVREAEKVMEEYNFSSENILLVKDIIHSHSCAGLTPTTLEGQILATADAMSHYTSDFFLWIATRGERNLEEYKEWALEKLDRNYNKKIFFSFAKKAIQKRHDALMQLLESK